MRAARLAGWRPTEPYRISRIQDDMVSLIPFPQPFKESVVREHATGKKQRPAALSTMVLNSTSAHHPHNRRRVLLLATDASGPDNIPTFLNAMGCTCTAVSSDRDALAMIEREPFDALLIDLGRSTELAERTILAIEEARSNLSERIVVISKEDLDPQTLEVIEHHNLVHVPQERLVSQLWITLEGLFVSRGSVKIPATNPRTPRLLFDSFRWPSPADVRGSPMSSRHFTYEHKSTIIEVFLDSPAGSEHISLVGQVLDAGRTEQNREGLPVMLLDGNRTLAQTTTNEAGEFNLEFDFLSKVTLEIRVDARSWVSIPLEEMDRMKRETLRRPTGS